MVASDPFLFCVYHKDLFPPAKEKLRKGNGADFDPNQPYRMYHGDNISGFPQHPHRGFETITATMEGYIDHTDSLGAAGRYGKGDLQWMTAGKGVVHGEMFPQVLYDEPNLCRFFQIWINLPAKNKMAPPSYVMHWSEDIPKVISGDKLASVTVWAGHLDGVKGLSPPVFSYGSDPQSEVAVWFISLKPGGAFSIPKAAGGNTINRKLYYVEGDALQVGDQDIDRNCVISVHADEIALLKNPSKSKVADILMLQGKPIGESVAQHGPFVMNTDLEIQQAFSDYRSTQFGGWPWSDDAVVFPPEKGRFTLQNGVEEFPPGGDESKPPRKPSEMSIKELKEAIE